MTKHVELFHAGHFIGGHQCQFKRATYVNGFLISSVGEYAPSMVFNTGKPRPRKDNDPFTPLGAGPHLYETLVFHAEKTNGDGAKCCPYRQTSGLEVEGRRHLTADEAASFHELMIEKYSNHKS